MYLTGINDNNRLFIITHIQIYSKTILSLHFPPCIGLSALDGTPGTYRVKGLAQEPNSGCTTKPEFQFI